MYAPWDSVSGMGSNKKYKKVKIRKQKLKSKKAKVELLFAADKADLIVEEYTDKVTCCISYQANILSQQFASAALQ